MSGFTEDERKAIALYAILARDAMDFLEMIREEPVAVLQHLRDMLALENPNHSRRTVELNKLGLSLVDGRMEALA